MENIQTLYLPKTGGSLLPRVREALPIVTSRRTHDTILPLREASGIP